MELTSSRREDLARVWNQILVPVVYRGGGKGQKLCVRLPYDATNREWLKNSRRGNPSWIREQKHWELPKAWFNDFVNRTLARFGKLYVIQPYREQEVCAPACMNAQGHECECSCMGANHGAGDGGGWFEVSETFATRWGERQIACRLMVKK